VGEIKLVKFNISLKSDKKTTDFVLKSGKCRLKVGQILFGGGWFRITGLE